MYFEKLLITSGMSNYPLSPFVCLKVALPSTDELGNVTVGPFLSTEAEIDVFVDRVTLELEQFREAAKGDLR